MVTCLFKHEVESRCAGPLLDSPRYPPRRSANFGRLSYVGTVKRSTHDVRNIRRGCQARTKAGDETNRPKALAEIELRADDKVGMPGCSLLASAHATAQPCH